MLFEIFVNIPHWFWLRGPGASASRRPQLSHSAVRRPGRNHCRPLRREERLTARPIVLKLIESGNSSADTRSAAPRRIRPHHCIAIDLQTPAGPTRIIQN